MNDGDFFRIDTVSFDHGFFRVMADRDDMIGRFQAIALDVVDVLIDILAAAVKFQGMDVQDQRPAADPSGLDAGEDGHPVVGMDDIERAFPGNDTRHPAVTNNFRDQIGSVVSGDGQEREPCEPDNRDR